MATNDPKLSGDDILGSDPGKVALKGILKGGEGAHTIRPAAMDGFQVAGFHRSQQAQNKTEELAQAEIRRLESQVAGLKSEVSQLKDRLERETKAAHNQGVQEGRIQGMGEGEKNAEALWLAQIDVIRKDVASSLDQLASTHADDMQRLRDATVELALGLARRLYCTEAENNPDIISHVIAEAFLYLGQEESLRVRVNPLDLTLAENGGSFWKPLAATVRSLELVADARVDRGGCVIDADKGGSIDLRLSTLLGNLENSVRAAYAQFKATESSDSGNAGDRKA